MVYLGDERLDLEPLGTTRIRPAGGAARRSVCARSAPRQSVAGTGRQMAHNRRWSP